MRPIDFGIKIIVAYHVDHDLFCSYVEALESMNLGFALDVLDFLKEEDLVVYSAIVPLDW